MSPSVSNSSSGFYERLARATTKLPTPGWIQRALLSSQPELQQRLFDEIADNLRRSSARERLRQLASSGIEIPDSLVEQLTDRATTPKGLWREYNQTVLALSTITDQQLARFFKAWDQSEKLQEKASKSEIRIIIGELLSHPSLGPSLLGEMAVVARRSRQASKNAAVFERTVQFFLAGRILGSNQHTNNKGRGVGDGGHHHIGISEYTWKPLSARTDPDIRKALCQSGDRRFLMLMLQDKAGDEDEIFQELALQNLYAARQFLEKNPSFLDILSADALTPLLTCRDQEVRDQAFQWAQHISEQETTSPVSQIQHSLQNLFP